MTDYSNIKYLVKQINNGGRYYRRGNFEIGLGGYDLGYELYFNDIALCAVNLEYMTFDDYGTADRYGLDIQKIKSIFETEYGSLEYISEELDDDIQEYEYPQDFTFDFWCNFAEKILVDNKLLKDEYLRFSERYPEYRPDSEEDFVTWLQNRCDDDVIITGYPIRMERNAVAYMYVYSYKIKSLNDVETVNKKV